jgi:hypothetical protein
MARLAQDCLKALHRFNRSGWMAMTIPDTFNRHINKYIAVIGNLFVLRQSMSG